ncbi:hypothetical protein EWM64_g3227 [Hericium alpestre]|uniref:BTB domain-containing protein n=1 Tax=Hericium alpestre TaxID=135208 RepID=A0A4Z0A0Z9_9AGAM|nr:hypothetical protein EWM64_g3227 [Hericium alpestre]
MLSLPPSNEAESYDGVPLVRMPDSAEDLERLLEVLYNQPMLRLKRFDPNTPHVVKPLLTLANKYDIQHLRKNIVHTLEEDWRQTLSEWDELEHYAEGKAKTCYRDLDQYREPEEFPDLHLPEAASAIRLARHCNIPSILPAAFYHLSRITIENDWDKTHVTHTNDHIPEYTELVAGARTARWDLVTREDFVCLFLGKERMKTMVDYWGKGGNSAPSHPHPGTNKPECDYKNWLKIWGVVERKCQQSSDVLKTLSDVDDILTSAEKPTMCYTCDEAVTTGLDDLRNKIWDNLRNYFALPA